MEHGVDFYPLLIVTALAVVVPVLLHRLRVIVMPIVVGEIIAGVVVGRSGFNLITDGNPYLVFLKDFGFAYLMFLSGLEVDFDLLMKKSRGAAADGKPAAGSPLRAALVAFLITVVLSLGFSYFLVGRGYAQNALIMALVLSTTSLGVVMPVLKEHGVIGRPLGQHILVLSIVADFATVLLVSAYVILFTEGLTFDVLLVLVLLAATFLVYRVARATRRHLPLERLVEDLSHATGQLDARGALALAVVFIALAQGVGAEAMLGAFLAGAIVSLLSRGESSSLRSKLNVLGYGFFIPIFFIMVGVEFNLTALFETPRNLLLVPGLLAIAYAVKVAAAFVYRAYFSWREVFGIGVLTSSRLSLIIAIAAVGVEIGAIEEATHSAVVLVSILTVVISPTLFHRLVARWQEPRRGIALIGSLPTVSLLAQRFRSHGEDVTVLTGNERFFLDASKQGQNVVFVAGRDFNAAVGELGSLKAVVSFLDDKEKVIEVTSAARESLGIENVIAVVKDPDLAERLKRDQVQVVDPGLSLVTVLEAMVHHPHAFSVLTQSDLGHTLEVVRLENPSLEGGTLRSLSLPGDALVLVVAREGEVIVPRGDTRLRRGDLVTVIGSKESVEAAAEHMGGAMAMLTSATAP